MSSAYTRFLMKFYMPVGYSKIYYYSQNSDFLNEFRINIFTVSNMNEHESVFTVCFIS